MLDVKIVLTLIDMEIFEVHVNSLIVIIIIRVILLDLNLNFITPLGIFIDAWALLSSLCFSFDFDIDLDFDIKLNIILIILHIIDTPAFHTFSYLASALFLEHG